MTDRELLEAAARVAGAGDMKTETLYRKVGRRYVAVSEWERHDGIQWPRGTHLSVCEPGHGAYRYNVRPDFAGTLAALMHAEHEVCDVMMREATLKPRLSHAKHARAWKAYCEIAGENSALWIDSPSVYTIYTALCNKLAELLADQPDACAKCGGDMRPGVALAQTYTGGAPDLGAVCTMSPGGPGKLVECDKCSVCGWSVT